MNNFETEKLSRFESPQKLDISDRVLTEVDHLLDARTGPNQFDFSVKKDVFQNLVTSVQEAAMPYAITTTHHEVENNPETQQRTFRWLGKTAIQTAMSGYKYHHHPNAVRRVDVEVDEARFASDTLRPGFAQVFISPRMSRDDATIAEARKEHLGDDDAVRISWLDADQPVQKRVMQSLLVRDIPLSAWTNMLKSPHNIWGKAIQLEDETSALSVMKAHRELEIDHEKLPNGPVTIIEEVANYIDDEITKQKVLDQIKRYYGDQELMHKQAEFKASRWLEFECELAESLATGRATSSIKGFIASMQSVWSDRELQTLNNHHIGDDLDYLMTRELAIILEKLKQNTLWGGAAVMHGNESVSKQMDRTTLDQIVRNEQSMFIAYQQEHDFQAIEAGNARLIGSANIKVGGGCAGNNNRYQEKNLSYQLSAENKLSDPNGTDDKSESWSWKKGICQVSSCSTRPGQTEVGPCSVCRSCQAKFDNGEDPTKFQPSSTTEVTAKDHLSVLAEEWQKIAIAKDKVRDVYAENSKTPSSEINRNICEKELISV